MRLTADTSRPIRTSHARRTRRTHRLSIIPTNRPTLLALTLRVRRTVLSERQQPRVLAVEESGDGDGGTRYGREESGGGEAEKHGF